MGAVTQLRTCSNVRMNGIRLLPHLYMRLVHAAVDARCIGVSLLAHGVRMKALSLLLLVLSLHSADFCDPDLRKEGDPRFPYEMRGDRCEGLYRSEKSSRGSFLVASLTSVTDGLQVARGASAEISWRGNKTDDIHLRAYSLARHIYFQMDTMVKGGRYRWPMDSAAAWGLTRGTIGVIAELSQPPGASEQTALYLPVAIGGGSAESATYTLTILPAVELTEVFLTVIPILPNGQLGKPLQKAKPLEYGYYPAERSVAIPLGRLEAGLHYVEVSAQLAPGGSGSTAFRIRIPGKGE